jgi:hypothetical protein
MEKNTEELNPLMSKNREELNPLKLNLQFFAEGGTNEEPGQAEPEGKESYTKDELLQLLQSETDKRVQQALKTQQKKYEKEITKQKSLVGLDEESRTQAEKDQQISDLEEELGKYRLSNTKAEISKVLNNRGLDANLVDFVVTTDDTDECLERIEALDKIFKAMLKKEVDARLRTSSGTPKGSAVGLDGTVTRESFAKMNLAEQAALATNNRQLYDELTKR